MSRNTADVCMSLANMTLSIEGKTVERNVSLDGHVKSLCA